MHFATENFGASPAIGGRHPNQGTQNALLSMRVGSYLEVIAPDPSSSTQSAFRSDLEALTSPKIYWWAWRLRELDSAKENLRKIGCPTSDIIEGARRTTDDSLLQWRLLFIDDDRYGKALPFLIDWMNTPHPSLNAPPMKADFNFSIHAPEVSGFRKILKLIGADTGFSIVESDKVQITWQTDPVG